MLKLAVCDDEKVFRSDLKRILSTVKYFSSDRRTVHAVTTDREYTFYEKLSDLEAELPGYICPDP